MPNPYEDMFEETPETNDHQDEHSISSQPTPLFSNNDSLENESNSESLDEILLHIDTFNKKAVPFSKLLSQIGIMEHKVDGSWKRLLFENEDKKDQGSLQAERDYHESLKYKFTQIIVPMKELGQLHMECVQQYNEDINKEYYSLEKSDGAVKLDKINATNGINLQRKILDEAANFLLILKNGLIETEKRIRLYINQAGANSISNSEFELLVQKRIELTNGYTHEFNYIIFDMSILDKAAISLGFYTKTTTSQYAGRIRDAFKYV